MARELILGTAGHIDHGKTSLVRALTGTDCDRLPEEKARGITIDIGFASLDLVDYLLGIVDVPGHERFIKNMLAGATGIDLALLVVAADDSVMPQTREHLEILKLLGLRWGVIALTKCDMVAHDAVERVASAVRELVADSFLATAPVVRTSAQTGQGVDDLKTTISNVCREAFPLDSAAVSGFPFRMAIDRAFVVQGHGTVVTGSVTSGSLRVGDEVEWQPLGQRVRVRSMQNHDTSVGEVHRGMRAALNLAGVAHDQVVRGQELASPGYLLPSKCMSVRIHASADVRRPLKHRQHVRLHMGTAEVIAVLALLDCDSIDPGSSGMGQLFLAEPAMAVWGQPFVLRESSAATTLGGGQVLQPITRKTHRHDADALARLQWLTDGPDRRRVEAVAWARGNLGVTARDLVREAGIAPIDATEVLVELEAGNQLVNLAGSLVHAKAIAELEDRILHALRNLHQEFPLVSDHDRAKVVAKLEYLKAEPLVQEAIERLIANRRVVAREKRLASSDFKPRLSANLQKILDKIVAAHAVAAFQPPDPGSFANHAGGNARNLNEIYSVAVAEGLLVRVADGVFLHSQAESSMRQQIVDKLRAGGPGLTVAEIRDMLGTTRKFAVPLCEYLDRIGVTRRQGDLRTLAK